MARAVNRLSARGVATLKEPGWHADGAGLYLRIDDAGGKRWVFVFQWKKKRAELGLGGAATVSLAKARAAAEAARDLVRQGKSPIEERQAAKEAEALSVPTFGEVLDEVIEAKKPEWKNAKHAQQWKNAVIQHAPNLIAMPVDEVGLEHVLKALKPIWTRIPETATRVRGRIETVLDAAKVKKLRTGENPARWRGNLEHLLAKRKKLSRGHHRALPYARIGAFMARLRRSDTISALALEFTILTLARTTETRQAEPSEIRLDDELWIVPAGRMKGAAEHRVPLVGRALEIARQLVEEHEALGDAAGPYLFPGLKPGKCLSNGAMSKMLKLLKVDDVATVHGFRSTFKDWAEDCTNFPNVLIETCLAHKVGNDAERAYRRSDALEKRRKMMEAWAGFCDRAGGGNVYPLSRRA